MAKFVYELGRYEFLRASQGKVNQDNRVLTLDKSVNTLPTIAHVAELNDGEIVSKQVVEGDDGWYLFINGVLEKKLA